MMPRRSDRPTIPPSFDVAQYAKDSDALIARVPRIEPEEDVVTPEAPVATDAADFAKRPEPRSEVRLVTRPKMGPTITDEAWARGVQGVLVVSMPSDQLKRLPLDHRAGFLLSMMDGSLDLDTLVEVSAMPRDQVLRLVRDLFESGVVAAR